MTDAALSLPVALTDASRDDERRRAKRNTRLVRRLRLAVPVVGTAIAVLMLAAAVLPKLLPFPLAGLSITADGLVMNAPRLAGHLGAGRRYEVVAERAVQSLLNPSRLSLEGLEANLDLGRDQQVTLRSATARYDTQTEVLELSDGVTVTSTDGNNVRLKAATVYLRDGRLEGDDGVDVLSPRGRIRAAGIDIIDGGALIRFTGGVFITIDPAS